MAKIKYSALVSDMRNKLNGSVLSKNRYGSYIRNKVTPVNPQTSYQVAQRANLASLSSAWRGLTQAQRDGWQALAQSAPRTDIFGDSKILAGNALFVSLNLNLLASGSAQIENAPSYESVPVVFAEDYSLVVSMGVNDSAEFNLIPATVPAGYALIVYATPSVSPGISFVKNRYRYLGTFTPTTGTVSIITAYSARFGNAVAGNKAFIRVALVNNTTGQLGLPSELSTIVGDL